MLRRLTGSLQSSQFCRVEQVCQKTSKTFGTGSSLKSTPSDGVCMALGQSFQITLLRGVPCAEKASSTSEFLKSFGILLEEPKQVSVVGR